MRAIGEGFRPKYHLDGSIHIQERRTKILQNKFTPVIV